MAEFILLILSPYLPHPSWCLEALEYELLPESRSFYAYDNALLRRPETVEEGRPALDGGGPDFLEE